jgi:diacylglycerol kinase family enzyme
MKRAAVIYNPIKLDTADIEEKVGKLEESHGWGKSLWIETTADDPGTGQAEQALGEKVDLVIVAGGDGTVRAVAAAMRGTGIPLALVPTGTGNLFARNLELTLDDADDALTTAFTGSDRPVDMGVIEIRDSGTETRRDAYLVMAGLGLDAKMLANTDDDLKEKAGWLAYVQAIGKALGDKDELRFRYRIDGGRVRSSRAHTIMVGNCGSLPANILLLPDALIDDGEFDIVVLRPNGFFGWVQIVVKVFWENGVLRRTTAGRKLAGLTKDVRALSYLKGKELVLQLNRPEEVELDGDSFGKATSIRTWVDPKSLLVRVPKA